jgi:radical SAM protein with 4Fe4S-binding SPASM domain
MIQYHRRPFKLREIKIEVTYRCPLACIHCSSDATPSSSLEMSREECLQIIHEAIQMGAKEVAFSGGEALIWSGLDEAIGTAIRGGLHVIIYTSGNIPNARARIERLAKLGVNTLIFSIFAATQTDHEQVTRIKGSFLKTRRAIDIANNNALGTELHFVPLANNYKDLEDIAHLSNDWGVTQISILRFVPQGRGALIKHRALNRIQNIQLKRTIERLRSKGFDIRTGSPYNFLMLNDQPKCSSAIDRLIIGPDLRIFPCDAFKQIKAEEVVGTIEFSQIKGVGLGECWESSPFLEAVREYLTTDFAEPCASCDALENCLSGCLAQKVIANGNFEKRPDPMCLLV